MSDLREHGAKTNWPWYDELPGRYIPAPRARKFYKERLARNRRRAEPRIIAEQRDEWHLAELYEAACTCDECEANRWYDSMLDGLPAQECDCPDCLAGITDGWSR